MSVRTAAAVNGAGEVSGDFDAFFRVNHRRLFHAMYLLTGDVAEAEELSQEALVRVYERWARVAAMESPQGYLYRVALNLHRSHLRHLARGLRRGLPEPSPEDPADRAGDRADIQRALGRLPESDRAALVLVDWLGMGSEEAGRLLGIKPASLRSRVHRGRVRLREELGGSDG